MHHSLGYYLAHHDRGVGRAVMVVLVLGLAVPFQVILTPVTQVLREIGLFGSYPGLLLVNVGYYVPFVALIFSRFARSIPREIDGAGPIRTHFRIVLPLMHPAAARVAIFVAVWVGNVTPRS